MLVMVILIQHFLVQMDGMKIGIQGYIALLVQENRIVICTQTTQYQLIQYQARYDFKGASAHVNVSVNVFYGIIH